MIKDGQCHHLEYRAKECQTLLPPSLHPSGGVYNFVNNDPTEAPIEVELQKVISCLKKHCLTEKRTMCGSCRKIYKLLC